MIAAILRAQFRSMRFGRGSALTAVARVIWYGIWTVAACAAGWWAAVANPSTLDRIISPALMGIFLYWQLIPLLSASMGASIDLRKLMAYPIPHRKLFLVEVLLRFTNGAEMVLVLIGGAIGVLANPAVRGWVAAARVVFSFLIFVLFNLLLASGTPQYLGAPAGAPQRARTGGVPDGDGRSCAALLPADRHSPQVGRSVGGGSAGGGLCRGAAAAHAACRWGPTQFDDGRVDFAGGWTLARGCGSAAPVRTQPAIRCRRRRKPCP